MLEVAFDQTQVRSNPPIIRLFRPKLPLIRPSPDHRPDRSALELPSRPCNFGLEIYWCALDRVRSQTNLGLDLNLGKIIRSYNSNFRINFSGVSLSIADCFEEPLKLRAGSAALNNGITMLFMKEKSNIFTFLKKRQI